jgi:hypothetical protein
MVKHLLAVSVVYLGAVGLALVFVPAQFGVDAVPADPSPELIALLRLLGGPMLGIAVLNWTSRTADPPTVRTVLLANLVGFGVVAANDVVGVATGDARDLARVVLTVHLAFAVAFAIAWTGGEAQRGPSPPVLLNLPGLNARMPSRADGSARLPTLRCAAGTC